MILQTIANDLGTRTSKGVCLCGCASACSVEWKSACRRDVHIDVR